MSKYLANEIFAEDKIINKYLLIQLEPPSIHPTQEIKSKSVETLNVISCITVRLSRTAIVSQCPIQTNYNNRSLSGKYQCLFYSATHQKCVQSAALLHFALLCSILLCTVPQKFSSRSAAIRHLGCALGDFPLLCKACLVWELLFSTIFRRHSPSTHNHPPSHRPTSNGSKLLAQFPPTIGFYKGLFTFFIPRDQKIWNFSLSKINTRN